MYSECLVTEMNPRSPDDGGPEKVPAESTITVEVTCTPVESDETSPSDNTGEDTGGSDRTDQPDQQSGENEDETGTPSESGG